MSEKKRSRNLYTHVSVYVRTGKQHGAWSRIYAGHPTQTQVSENHLSSSYTHEPRNLHMPQNQKVPKKEQSAPTRPSALSGIGGPTHVLYHAPALFAVLHMTSMGMGILFISSTAFKALRTSNRPGPRGRFSRCLHHHHRPHRTIRTERKDSTIGGQVQRQLLWHTGEGLRRLQSN